MATPTCRGEVYTEYIIFFMLFMLLFAVIFMNFMIFEMFVVKFFFFCYSLVFVLGGFNTFFYILCGDALFFA